jgi:1,4-alpha-glucan branching enzyme
MSTLPTERLLHPDWCRDAAIYELNTRQFTAEGTLAAAQRELPRLRALGVTIIWLMPIHPIGELRRKGTLGSPYAVRDYLAVDAQLGSFADLRSFVAAAHALGLYVILDWVANHSAWDNPLTEQHPEWYARDWRGSLTPTPWWDWDDVVDFDYSQPGLRDYMSAAMQFWVREAAVDGFRCDVAGFVPTDFWERVRRDLEAIKPVFLLAEAEDRELHRRAFDMSYGWSWHNALHAIAQGKGDVGGLRGFYSWHEKGFGRDALRMLFVSNHDKNSWEGTEYELFGDALDAAIVLSVVSDGLPLIYNGQEAGNRRRLAFFEKDPIDWQPHRYAEFYGTLLAFKRAQPALWNGAWGAPMINIVTGAPQQELAFVRAAADGSAVAAFFRLSNSAGDLTIDAMPQAGDYRDAFDGSRQQLVDGSVLTLPAWGWRVFVRDRG